MRDSITHDFTRISWGHNLEIKQTSDGKYKGFSWSTPTVRVGDHVRWETNYGYATALVTWTKFAWGVDDMTALECEVVSREFKERG